MSGRNIYISSKIKFLFILLALLIIEGHSLNIHATSSSDVPFTVKSGLSTEMKESSAVNSQQDLRIDVAMLKEKVETITTMMNILIGVLLAILTIGGLASLFGWYKAEKRTQEAYDFFRESHALFTAGEQASQSRAGEIHSTFLERSTKTLDLVNDTLTLAKEASERAAKFIENKAKKTLIELDFEANDLITRVSEDNARPLVADPTERSKTRTLAQKIAGFEINLFVLPTELKLTSNCLFIKGMALHIAQQFQEAIESWRFVALDQQTSDQLKRLAWYWIGVEYNNLGEFENALKSFTQALDTAEGPPKYELQRILLETRFFNRQKERVEDLIQPCKELLDLIGKESKSEKYEEIKSKILTLVGSLYYQIGNQLSKDNLRSEANKAYEEAESYYERAAIGDPRASFGLAETYYKLKKIVEAERLFQEKIRPAARTEFIRKEEPRIKLLALTTELICCIRVHSLKNDIQGVYNQVIGTLGQVDGRLTVYSQIQMRNIKKDEFEKELSELINGVKEI